MEDTGLQETSTSSSSNRKEPLDGWTREDKYQLYLGIRLRGSKSVKEIQEEYLPDKTEDDIQVAIAQYRELANQNPECAMKKLKVRRTKTKPLIPLASWAKLLTDSLSYKELQTESVSALRLIADLEQIPGPASTEQIDFRKVYNQVADAMEGKSLPENRLISEVLSSCVLNTALVSKAFIRPSSFRNILNTVDLSERELPMFPKPTKDNELAIIRHLAGQRNYNPLNILEENLTANAKVSKD